MSYGFQGSRRMPTPNNSAQPSGRNVGFNSGLTNAYPPQSMPYPRNDIAPSAYPPINPTSGNFQYSTPSSSPYPSHNSPLTPYPTLERSYPSQNPSSGPYPSQNPSSGPYPSQNLPVDPYATSKPYPGDNYPNSCPPNNPQNSANNYPASQPSYDSANPRYLQSNLPANANCATFGKATGDSFSHAKNSQQKPQSEKRQGYEKYNPTILPVRNFNVNDDINALRKAMKGLGTDETALISIICNRSNAQRQEIRSHYKGSFGKDLIDDLHSELSGNFRKTIKALMMEPIEYYVKELNRAVVGLGTDEQCIIDIMCTLSFHELNAVKAEYFRKYERTLEKDLKDDTSGYFARLLVALCNVNSGDFDQVNQKEAQLDAENLYKAGEKRFGTDEVTFIRILSQRNCAQIRQICAEYTKFSRNSLERAIEKEFSGCIERGLLTIVKNSVSSADCFAEKLHKSMKGLGTDDDSLIRCVVSRSEIDLEDIKVAFQRKYKGSLAEWIKDDTSGHYRQCLLAIVK